MYDLVFLSYNEKHADAHWEALEQRMPRAQRVQGVEGIVAAHKAAAAVCDTRWFWVVDADNQVDASFGFTYKWPMNFPILDAVAVWRARNNVNGLEYGYGGVKLLPRRRVLDIAPDVVDFTTSIGKNFHIMKETASTTLINGTPFEAWKSGFRECAKLTSNVISGSLKKENQRRLDVWLSVAEGEYADEVLRGASEGATFGETQPDQLHLLNDFGWLQERFENG